MKKIRLLVVLMFAMIVNFATAQNLSVKGVVTDETGVPLIGVVVAVDGTSNAVATTVDGTYLLKNVPSDANLVFTYAGMTTLVEQVKGRTEISVQMEPSAELLDEIIVVGYGTQKKETLTAAASTLKAESLETLPVTNLSSALGGRISGILVQQTSGEAGYENPQIIIRGISSPTSSDPLIVVDGIPGRSMSQLDPTEIASFTVLKDASAVAPYGARGANGVILITTKRGKEGKATVNYSFKGGFGEATCLPEIASSYDHARLMNEAYRNTQLDSGIDPGMYGKYTEEELTKFLDGSDPYGYPNTNWVEETLLDRAWQQQHNATVSGGSENIKYFAGFGFVDQSALYGNVRTNTPTTGFQRYNFRTNIDATIVKDYLNFSADVSYREEIRNTISESTSFVFQNMFRNPQTDVGIFPDGNYGKVSLGYNPIAMVNDGGWQKNTTNTLNTRFALDLNVPGVEGLNVKGIFSYDKWYYKSKSWDTPVYYYVWDKINGQYTGDGAPDQDGASLEESFSQSQTYTAEVQASYNRTFGDHQIGALAVFNATENSYDYFWAGRYKYQFTSITQLFAGPDADKDNGGYASEYGKLGSVFRLTYNYKERYMVEANGRIDGSEKFPADRRFGFFPSVSVAWRISEEEFMKQATGDWLTHLKLRASWGQAGNDDIDRFLYQSAYGVGSNAVFGGMSSEIAMGYTETRFANSDITWETSTMMNVGVDANLWNGLLTLEADYFYKITEDILLERTDMPGLLGYEIPAANVGIVDNRGVDVTVSHQNQIGDFNYSVSGNVTWARNKIIDLLEPDGQKNNPRIRETGNSMNQYYGYESDGLFQSDEEADNSPQPTFGTAKAGDIKYVDQNGDGKITSEDIVAIGKSSYPELVFGLNFFFQYKGFDLSLFFQGAGLTDFYYGGYIARPYGEGQGSTLLEHHIGNYWTADNPDAEFPRLYYGTNSNNNLFSDFWLRDGSYLRLKNVELGYDFTDLLKAQNVIQGIRLFVSATNLFTWSEIEYFDPETRSSSGLSYPQMKNYTLGVNITF